MYYRIPARQGRSAGTGGRLCGRCSASPWTIELPLTQIDNRQNQIFEAACHEGNCAMTAILAGARSRER